MFSNKKVVMVGPSTITEAARKLVFQQTVQVLKDGPHSITIGGTRGVGSIAFTACA